MRYGGNCPVCRESIALCRPGCWCRPAAGVRFIGVREWQFARIDSGMGVIVSVRVLFPVIPPGAPNSHSGPCVRRNTRRSSRCTVVTASSTSTQGYSLRGTLLGGSHRCRSIVAPCCPRPRPTLLVKGADRRFRFARSTGSLRHTQLQCAPLSLRSQRCSVFDVDLSRCHWIGGGGTESRPASYR